MEKERSSSGSGLTANGFVWLAAVAAGVILVRQLPWEDSRPLGTEPKPYRYEAEQDIDARLWQDPLGAVARGRQEYRKGRESVPTGAPAFDPPGHSACDLKDRIIAVRGDGRRPLIVGAMVSGGPYPDDAEVRRRARYAVLAGLSQMGFVPEDSGHLGYFTLGPSGSGRRKDLPAFVAYEWFSAPTARLSRFARTSNPQPPDSVLLLWLDEDVVGNAPVASVERVKEILLGAGQSGDPCLRSSKSHIAPSFVILGPGYSSSLQAMANEAVHSSARSNGSRISFYAYGATVQDSQVLPLPAVGSGEISASFSDFFRGRQPQVLRTIDTDDKLAKELTAELGRRGVDPARTTPYPDCKIRERALPQHVILIAERDSVYSRSLPVAMERYLSHDDCSSHGFGSFPTRIHHYSYLRGLDGQLPGLRSGLDSESGKKDGFDKEEKTSASARSAAEKGIERAEGQGQFDYLRRLSMQIQEDVVRNGGEGQIRAIGVLGSDVYDKLVVLQALRPQFPDAIFFTTDLDARLLHPRELPWTRNLIVASSFGLHLRPELQRDIPPFRDSYQTSLYLATLIALNNAGHGKTQVDPAIIQHWFERPRLFEVGRRGPFDLSGQRDAADVCAGVDKLAGCGAIHPKPANMFPTPPKGSLSFVIPLLFGLLMLPVLASGAAHRIGSAVVQWAHRREPDSGFDRLRVAILVAVGVALTIALVWADVRIDDIWQRLGGFLTQGGEGEPIALLDGISLWPSELIRLLSFALSVIFVVWGWRALDRNLDTISAELMFQPQREELLKQVRAEQAGWRWWTRLGRAFSFRLEEVNGERINPLTGLTPAAEAFWRKYAYQGRWWARFWRVLAATAAYLVFAGIVIWAFGRPEAPYRGEVSRIADKAILVPSVLAMQFLIFFVVDATVFCYQFITGLRRDLPDQRVVRDGGPNGIQRESRWPESTLNHYAAKLRVDKRYLDDWISMHCIARRTRVVAQLIYLPFIVISLMIFARSSTFDNWSMPMGLLVVFAGSVLIVVFCAILLRWSAEVSRRKAVWRLTNELVQLKGKGEEGRRLAEQIQVMINQIGAFTSGAFAPYSQQPFLRALLLPLGSYGGSALLEYLAMASL